VSLDGQFLRFNEPFARLVGRSAHELRAYQLALDVAPPPDQRGLSFVDALGLRDRVDIHAIRGHLVASELPYEIEYELVRRDGTTIWIHVSMGLVGGTSAPPPFFVVVGREVTMRRRVEIALRRLVETLAATGPGLFTQACSFLGTTLGARCVLVGRLDGASMR